MALVTRENRTGNRLVARVTEVLFRHDPAMLVSENPDLPRDEYEYEAEEILRRLGSESRSESNVISTVIEVFEKALGGNQVVSRAAAKRGC
jgi:hypothetical protein